MLPAALVGIARMSFLSEFCAELLLKSLLQFGHNGFDLLIFEGILSILQDE